MSISANTRLVALLGNPVAHSLSPLIHNTGFERLGVDMAYVAFRVDGNDLGTAVSALKALGFVGANVTIPHKQEVIFHLDRMTDRATAVGAVNTLVCRPDEESGVCLVGDNTDVAGFVKPIERHRNRLEGSEALVWGSGGAARAVIWALLENLGLSRVHVVSRNDASANALARALDETGERVVVTDWEYMALPIQRSSLLVNATPVGMGADTSPCLQPELVTGDHIVYDLVYSPGKTALLAQGRAAGAVCIEGIEMLIGQAASSFEAWTGSPLPEDEVRRALENQL